MKRSVTDAVSSARASRRCRRAALCAAWLSAAALAACVAAEGGGGYGPAPGGGPPPPPLPPRPPEIERIPPPAPSPPPPPRGAALRAIPAGLAFGFVEIGLAVEQELTVANEGDGGAEVLSVSVDGEGFRLVGDGCGGRWLGPRRSCSVRVRFAPPEGGSRGGTLSVLYADAGRRRLDLPLRGEGVRRRAAPRIEARPRRLAFGGVDVGVAAVLTLEIGNRGDGELRIRDVSVEGRDFELAGDGCSRAGLRPRRECELQVRFVPTRRGRSAGQLRVRSDDPEEPLLTLPLEGEGRGRRDPDIRVRDRRLDFGAVAAGEVLLREAVIENAGEEDLRVREVALEGRAFSVASDGCSGRKVAPGRDCRIGVRFAPAAPGRQAGRLTVGSDDPDEKLVAIALEGAGAEEPRPRCPVVRLAPLPGEEQGESQRVVTGALARGECITYALRVRRDGRLIVCVPPGYALEARGFAPVKGEECRLPDDPVRYRKHRRTGIAAGTDLRDLTITRGDDASRNFKILFGFRERREREAEGDDD